MSFRVFTAVSRGPVFCLVLRGAGSHAIGYPLSQRKVFPVVALKFPVMRKEFPVPVEKFPVPFLREFTS